jgi:hypothetical protein
MGPTGSYALDTAVSSFGYGLVQMKQKGVIVMEASVSVESRSLGEMHEQRDRFSPDPR